MQAQVLSAHLALANLVMALDVDKDPIPPPDAKPPPPSKVREYNRDLQRRREEVMRMASSPAEYVRAVGYHALFDLEPPEREKPKTASERVKSGMAAAKRALASLRAED
jgi:hypothetical protein